MDIKARQARTDRAWTKRAEWDGIYNEAKHFLMPWRRSGVGNAGVAKMSHLFDMTGPASMAHFGGEIQRLLFPVGTPFHLAVGPLPAANLKPDELRAWNLKLAELSRTITPYFQTGNYDNAVHDFCVDLGLGTSALVPVKGPSIEQPLFFVHVPIEHYAVEWDGFGRLALFSWKSTMTRRQVLSRWPDGKFSDDFKKQATDKPDDPVIVIQEYDRGSLWTYTARINKSDDAIFATSTCETQPVVVTPFMAVPGSDYGVGPGIFVLPTVRTQNKARELVLRGAAIQMLGIWGYRAGGTLNPQTLSLTPGAMWPMQSTGGIMGPDVQRLDPATARLDIGQSLLDDGKQSIRETLLDTRLFDDGGTPASASEIALKMQQNGTVHMGAYGRLVNSVLPVLVPRAVEILQGWGLVRNMMPANQLLMTMTVRSPMQLALAASNMQATLRFGEIVSALLAMPPEARRYVPVDRMITQAREDLMLPPTAETTKEEKAAFDKQAQDAQANAMIAEMATRAAPQLATAAFEPQQKAA